VFVHRDPLRVLASVARLTEVLRRPFTRHVDRPALGHQELERWSSGTELMIRAADEDPFAEPIFHVQYSELVADPLGTVEALYRHFGLTLDPAAASAIARMVEAKPNGGYGTNHAGLDAYRIDSVAARERFAPYLARFGIAREPTPAGVPRPQPSIGSRPVVALARRRSSG